MRSKQGKKTSTHTQIFPPKLVKLFFSYSPPPGIHPPPPPTPFPGSRFRVVFLSFWSRFRVEFDRKRPEIDAETTEKRLEIDSLGRRWWWGMNPGGWAVAEKQFHHAKSQRGRREDQKTPRQWRHGKSCL